MEKTLVEEDKGELKRQFVEYWNKTIKEDNEIPIVYFIGNVCDKEAEFEEVKSIITQLNGNLVLLSTKLNDQFTKKQWEEIGFLFCWDIDLFYKTIDGKRILFCHNEYDTTYEKKEDVDIIVVNRMNSLDEIVKGKLLSLDAKRWFYSPINCEEIPRIYEGMKEFSSMENSEERSDVTEEGETNDIS